MAPALCFTVAMALLTAGAAASPLPRAMSMRELVVTVPEGQCPEEAAACEADPVCAACLAGGVAPAAPADAADCDALQEWFGAFEFEDEACVYDDGVSELSLLAFCLFDTAAEAEEFAGCKGGVSVAPSTAPSAAPSTAPSMAPVMAA